MTAAGRPRRIVPVACRTRQGDPDGVHLAVEEWIPRVEMWVTSPALCGQSAEQGALPADTMVTCTDGDGSCESYHDSYQRALDGRPTAQQEETDRLRAECERLGGDLDVYREEVRTLQDQLEQVAYDRTWPPDRERPADVRREVERVTTAGAQQVEAVKLAYKAARIRWDRERDRLVRENLDAANRAQIEIEQLRAAAALTTEYRIPCPGHRLGAGADLIVQRMPTEDRWAIFNPNLDSPLRVWTGERYERIGTDIYRREGFCWSREEALDLVPGLAGQETARDWAWFEEMRTQAAGGAQ
ncbi:hypothetical protein ABZ619_38640 [Streptomyces sp. NPDC007851]|uniref:hypothetical protein n=1 Tax=Streptomyces sp. NPDC007851 TaxID=3155008 RepID=UPI0033D4E851